MPNVIASPQGESKWFKGLGEPHSYDDNPEDRAWTVELLLDEETAPIFKQILKEYFIERWGNVKKVAANGWPFGPDTNKNEDGEAIPSGKVKFKFKRKEFNKDGIKKNPPIVVDAAKNPWPSDKLIGNGSTIRIGFRPWFWEMNGKQGMSLEWESAQVVKLQEYEKEVPDVFSVIDGGTVIEQPIPEECPMPDTKDQFKEAAAAAREEAKQEGLPLE